MAETVRGESAVPPAGMEEGMEAPLGYLVGLVAVRVADLEPGATEVVGMGLVAAVAAEYMEVRRAARGAVGTTAETTAAPVAWEVGTEAVL